MKILLSLITALLIAGQVFTPAGAARLAAGTCGNAYIVQNKDTLISIALLCGTTVAEIMELNPQIANPNLVYNGQEIVIRGKAPKAVRVTYTLTAPTTYEVKDGDTFLAIATMFGTSIWEIVQANPGMTFFTKLTPGMELQIPAGKRTKSYTLYINRDDLTYPNARVEVSALKAQPGDDIHVTVKGFPPGAWIDYEIGVVNKGYSYIYDGTIDDDGNAGLTFEIPNWTKDGEQWLVHVKTTSQKKGVQATSAVITVDY